MKMLNIILWAIASLAAIILIPLFWNYLKNKLFYSISIIRIKIMARKYDGELKEMILKIADDLKTYSKQETLLGNEGDI